MANVSKPRLYQIKDLERGSRDIKNGAVTQTGIYVTLTDVNTEKDRNQEFLSDYHNADLIATLENIGVNGRVMVSFIEKPGRGDKSFWNMHEVKPGPDWTYRPGNDAAQEKPTEKPNKPVLDAVEKQNPEDPALKKTSSYAYGKDYNRQDAMSHALSLTTALVNTGAFGKAKGVPELANTHLFRLAHDILKFYNGDYSGKVESDTGDLNSAGVDANEPELRPDWTDRHPTEPEDDDIPF